MPNTDTPTFFNNIIETDDDKARMSPLMDDEPAATDDPNNPEDPNKKEVTTTEPGQDDPSKTEDPNKDKTPTDDPNADPNKKEGEEDPNKKTEEDPNKVEQPKTIEYNGKKYSEEEFKQYTQSLEKAAEKIDKPNEQTEKMKQRIRMASTQPLFEVKVPDVDNYYLTDKEGNKTFDIATYMEDTLKTFAVAMQGSIAAGPLAAIQFGLLKEAFSSEFGKITQNNNDEKEAEDITNKLLKEFPRLETDEKLANKVTRALEGERAKREREAKAAGKQATKPTWEEIRDIVADEIATMATAPATQKDDPLEPSRPGPALNGQDKKTVVSPEEQAIDEMFDLKAKKNGSIF